MDHNIRQATLDDLATIVRHRRHMVADIGLGDPVLLKKAEPIYREWLLERLRKGTYQGWLMTAADGSVMAGVGLWLLEWPPGVLDLAKYRGYVFNVYTERTHRKKGFSRRLMGALLEACVEHGVHVVSLHTSPEARSGYEALDFTPTQEMRIILPRK